MDMTRKQPDEIARALMNIYESDFGGKPRGRFQISRTSLRELSGRKRLEESTLNEIRNETYELGYVLTDLGDDFSMVELDVMRNYRRVPARLIAAQAGN